MIRSNCLLKKIFSIENDGIDHKKITILGIKIRVITDPRNQYYYNDLPIQNNKIIFRNHTGSYGCNVKYISEEIFRQKLPYDIVWIVNKNILRFQKDYPKNVRLVMGKTQEAYREYATAKIWVDTDRRASYIKKGLFKRDNQVYIQCFHGAFGIKKCGSDRKDRSKNTWKPFITDAKQMDYLISNSTQATNFFTSSFWGFGKILEFGQPRNDIFFKNNSKLKEKIYKKFNIPDNKKIILYAPTYRETKDTSCYSIDFKEMVDAMSKKFGEDYVVMLRLHPFFAHLKDKFINDFECIVDGTDHSDMQELLAIADILITDYSSCLYDFMLSNKPGFIFATDREEYENNRGLYYPLSTTPFPVAENNDELIKNIENFDYEAYKVKLKEFMKEKGCVDDGHACERVVDLIKQIIDQSDSEKVE